MSRAWLASAGRFFSFCVCLTQKGGDIMLDLFDILFLLIEIISLIIQIKEYRSNNRTANVVVIVIKINR